MPTFVIMLFLGFILGLRHATDADHVIAISTITSREKSIKRSTLIGLLWGIGHSITVSFIGIPIILFSIVIPKNAGLLMEVGVGVMLIILGLLNLSGLAGKLTKLSLPDIHKHSHSHPEESKHSHFHIHFPKFSVGELHHLGLFQTLRPIVIGLVHGLAGSAAIALLILSTINSKIISVFYLFIFHLGVIAGMMLITTFLGISFSLATRRINFFNRYLINGSGWLSVLFGAYIVSQSLR